MNINRFYSTLEMIKEDFRKYRIIQLMEQLNASLNQSINKPAEYDPDYYEKAYSKLKLNLMKCSSNSAPLSMISVIEELQLTNFIGVELLESIDKILGDRKASQTEIYENYDGLLETVGSYRRRISSLVNSMEVFNIKGDGLLPGESEIGLLIPPKVVNSSISGLSKDFGGYDKYFKLMREIVGEDIESMKVKSLNSSDFFVILASLPPMALAVAKTLESLARAYKALVEAKSMQKAMLDKDMPEKVTGPLKEYIIEMVDTKLSEISEEIVDEFYTINDDGRKNELKKGLKNSLKFLASRINRGTKIEVIIGEPIKPTPATQKSNPEKLKAYEELRKLAETIGKSGQALKEISASGEDVFYLPEEIIPNDDTPE